MKKLLLPALFAMAAISSAQAQHIEFGLHGGYGTTWMFNKNVSDAGDELDYKASFAPVFGIEGGYFFASRIGLIVDVDYAFARQKYTGANFNLSSYEYTDKLSYIELPIMLRKYSKSGFYLEIGPKFSFLAHAAEDAKFGNFISTNYTDRDVKVGYKKTIVSAAFGIGSQFEVGKNLYLNVALRLAYGFTDATETFSQSQLDSKFYLSKEISEGTYAAHLDQKNNYAYQNTNLVTGYITAGLNYRLPQVKKKPGASKTE